MKVSNAEWHICEKYSIFDTPVWRIASFLLTKAAADKIFERNWLSHKEWELKATTSGANMKPIRSTNTHCTL